MRCPALATEGAFLSSLLDHLDCQGRTLGAAGYQALADPASPVSAVVTGILTLYIALFGLRMILGATPGFRDSVLAVAKIGIVLTIATSWPAFRTVIHDVVTIGPAQLSQVIGAASGLPGANGDLTARLQRVDNGIIRLTTLGSGRNDLTSRAPEGRPGETSVERAPLTDDLAFGAARIIFVSSIVAGSALVSLGAGVLLALAPLFAGLLLFDTARGLFVGWLRALAFIFLASVAATIIVGVELALLEPWLSRILQLRQARLVTSQAPLELLILCLGFGLTLFGTMAVLLRVAFMMQVSLRLPQLDAVSEIFRPARAAPRSSASTPSETSGRALAIANAVAASQRRESAAAGRTGRLLQGRWTDRAATSPATATTRGVSASRRAKPRKSLASSLRDRKS